MANDLWRTPEWVWKPYGLFDLDAAADAQNTLAPAFISKEMDALTCDWRAYYKGPGRVWCNPPYSQAAGPLMRWCEVFAFWQVNGFSITVLLPADTSTKWFHFLWDGHQDSVWKITFLKRRVRHLDPQTGKPGGSPKFGSLIVQFK